MEHVTPWQHHVIPWQHHVLRLHHHLTATGDQESKDSYEYCSQDARERVRGDACGGCDISNKTI